ncbi:MAG: GAF domain-containing protein, partial [Chloroflexota bacterium]
ISVRLDSELVQFLAASEISVDLSEVRTWPKVVHDNPILLREQNVALLVPLNRQTTLLGWLAVSPENGRELITQNEMGYISALADQSLLGLERASVEFQLQERIAELDQLSNFSQFLAFTIDTEDLFELVFTNNQRLLDVDDFYIALKDVDTHKLYHAFYIEKDERIKAKEGVRQSVTNTHVHKAFQSGQVEKWIDSAQDAWIAAPLNVGAETLGAVYTVLRNTNNMIGPQRERLFLTYAQRTAVALERLQTNERLTQQAQRLQIINQVTFSLASTLELEPLLDLIMDKAIELFDAQAGSLLLSDQETGELVFEIVRGPAEAELLNTRLPIGTGIAGTAAQQSRSIITNDVSEDDRWYSELDEENQFRTRSILTVPLLRHNRVLGVVQVINKGSGALFDENDQRLLTAFASQAVVALENARLVEQTDQKLQTSVEELSMLQQLDRDLNTSLALDNVFNITLARLMTMIGGSAGAIVLKDFEGLPQIRTWRNYDRGFDATKVTPKMIENSPTGTVLTSGKPLIVDNVHEALGYHRARFETLSQLILPLNHQQEVIGTIVIESDEMAGFTKDEENTAVRIANHAAIAIANAVLYEQVKEANLAKSEFVSMVSHELKTPMTAVRGYVDLMLSGLMGDLTDQQKEYLEIVSANISRMGQQIQDLTDISRIETGRLHMEFKATDLRAVVDETMKSVLNLIDEKSIKLNVDMPANIPHIEADKGRLVQVMTNLLSNACKYSPENTAVTVRFSLGEQNSQAVVCGAVKDSGYGISEEDQEKLFTKFFRSDDPNIRKAKGTGLGLSITKGIIELHGGEMWFESTVGQGTTFFFSLPIEHRDEE